MGLVGLLPAGKGEIHPHTAKAKDKEAKARQRRKVRLCGYTAYIMYTCGIVESGTECGEGRTDGVGLKQSRTTFL